MNDMVEKFRALVQKIYEATKSKKLAWGYDVDGNFVAAEVLNNVIKISHAENYKAEPIVVFTMYAAGGEVLEEFNDDNIKGANYAGMSYYELMLSVFDMAKRQATGADKALDAVLKGLDDLL